MHTTSNFEHRFSKDSPQIYITSNCLPPSLNDNSDELWASFVARAQTRWKSWSWAANCRPRCHQAWTMMVMSFGVRYVGGGNGTRCALRKCTPVGLMWMVHGVPQCVAARMSHVQWSVAYGVSQALVIQRILHCRHCRFQCCN